MLQQLRDKAKSFVSSAMLILLIISFGIWGVGDIFRQGNTKDWVVKVGDAKLGASVVKREFDNEVAQMRGLLGPEFTKQKAAEMGFLERAIEKLASLTVVNLETNRLGYNIPKDEILKTLEATPQLRNADGTFNKEMFARVLASQGMNEPMFINAQQQIAARNIIVRGLSAPIVTPDAMLNDLAAAYAQKRVAETVEVDPEAMQVDAKVDEAALKKFYDENKENYKLPETRNISVLTLTPEDAGKDVHVTEEDLHKAFEDRKKDFDLPEQRSVQQVVVSDEEKAKNIAAAALLGNLKSAAKAAGADAVALDKITKNDLPPELAEVVFKADVGKIKGPVQSNLGWHVFVVESVLPAKSQSFEEARPALQEQLRKDQSAERMVQMANKVDDMLAGGKSIDDIAAAQGLKVSAFNNLDKSRASTTEKAAEIKIPFQQEVMKATFQYNEGETSPLLESREGGYALVHVNKVIAAHVEEYEAVKTRLSDDYIKNAKNKKAVETAEAIAKQLESGKALAEISGPGLSKKTSAPLIVDNKEEKDVPREAIAPLFDKKKGEVVVLSLANSQLVLRVKDILPGTKEEVDARKQSLSHKLEQDTVTAHLDAFTAALRKAYPVVTDKAGLDRLIGSNDGG